MPTSRWLAPLALLVAATTWGLVWYPYRLLEQTGMSGSVSSVLTYLVALPPLLFLSWRERGAARQEWGLLLALALVAGWTNLAYILAVIDGEVVRVMLLFYLAPLWTVPFAHVLLKERASRGAWLVIAFALVGAWVMLAELVVAALASRWLAGEVMDRHEWIGGGMIVAATLFSGRMQPDD